MAPRKLRAKHHIIRSAPGKCPHSEAYYEWSSEEEIAANLKEHTKEVCSEDEDDEEDLPLPLPEDMEEIEFKKSSLPAFVGAINVQNNSSRHVQEDILPTPYHDLPPAIVNALRATDEMCAQNQKLTQEVIALEEENRILRGIIAKRISPPSPKRKLEYTGMGTTLSLFQAWGRCPGILSPSLLPLLSILVQS